MAPSTSARQLLSQLLAPWQQLLQGWAQEGLISRAASEALGLNSEPRRLQELVRQWAAGEFRALPAIKLLPAAAMPGAAGAYASSTGTIYLNQDWLQGASRQQALAVLNEELGHHLDALLNRRDTPGDEGELFAALLQGGGRISRQHRQRLRNESDQGTAQINGQALAMEQAAVVSSTPIPVASPGRSGGEFRSRRAFAALKNDGSVVSWGDPNRGGNNSIAVNINGRYQYESVSSQLSFGVSQIFSNGEAFAALKSDGSVVTWGPQFSGGYSGGVTELLRSGVSQIFSTFGAFAALKTDGSVVTWGSVGHGGDSRAVAGHPNGAAGQLSSGVVQISSNESAFAALKMDGSVVTWGGLGGDSSGVAEQLSTDVFRIYSSRGAFAALKVDGSVIAWGVSIYGGDSSEVADQLSSNVVQIFATEQAFAALKSDGSVVTWGDPSYGGNSSMVADQLSSDVVQIFSSRFAFAALKLDGSVVTWGAYYSNISAVADQLSSGVEQIFSTGYAFAALKSDGSVVTWGDASSGGNSSAVASRLSSGVSQIFATDQAFAALKSDGSVVTWGDASSGGNSSAVAGRLSSSVSQIFATDQAFAALKSDGSVVTWGDASSGGNSSAVAGRLTNVVAFADPFADDRLVAFTELLPDISLVVSPASVSEDGSADLVFTFTRSGLPDKELTVAYSVSGSASLGTDYSGIHAAGTTKMLTFAAGSDTATVTIDPTADTEIEASETVELSLIASSDYTIATTTAVSGMIRNDDFPSISLALSPASVTEDGSSNLIYTFRRSGPATSILRVNYSVAGTASLGTDYSGISSTTIPRTISFAVDSTTATVTVDPKSDTAIEPDETVALTLLAGSGYTIGTSTAVIGTISNDDLPPPAISLSLASASVPEDGSTNLVFSFTRTGAASNALTVNYSVGGTATLGSDYIGIASTPATKTVSFAAGSDTASVTVDPTADTTIEADETVVLTLAAGQGYTIGTTAAVTGTISNDDIPSITLSLSPAAVSENGTANLIYTFNRNGAAPSALTVNYSVAGTALLAGSASEPADYVFLGSNSTATTRSISFAAGASSVSVSLDPSADSGIEPDETIALSLLSGTGYTIGTTEAVIGTILNDDFPRITLAATTASVSEDAGSPLLYTFSRSVASATELTVNYSVGGTATLGTDYSGIAVTPSTKSVTFAAGSPTTLVTILPTADTTIEAHETVALTLAAGTGYSIGTSAAVTGTISNDDFPSITLALASPAVLEDGSSNLVFLFTRTGITSSALTINYSVAGSASLGSDYTGVAATPAIKTLTFAAASATASVSVDPTADTTIEPDETVVFSLVAGTGYTIDSSAAVTGTISNDDLVVPSISLAVSPAAVTEDGSSNLVYTFTRIGPSTDTLTVNYSVAGSASLGSDYSGIDAAGTIKTVSFAAGSATTTVRIDPSADTQIEPNETVSLTLAAGTGYTISTSAAVTGTIRNDDMESAVSSALGSNQSSLRLSGTKRINGTGNNLENTIIGNAANNRLTGLGGKDILTGGGTTDRDVFVFLQLSDSLLLDPNTGSGGSFDEITDFNSNDRLTAPFAVDTELLTAALATAASIDPTAIAAVLTPTSFAADGVAAITISSHPGTFIAMNDGRAGFQSDTDAIIWLRNYAISTTNFVEFI